MDDGQTRASCTAVRYLAVVGAQRGTSRVMAVLSDSDTFVPAYLLLLPLFVHLKVGRARLCPCGSSITTSSAHAGAYGMIGSGAPRVH
jgi:hypothetical protein